MTMRLRYIKPTYSGGTLSATSEQILGLDYWCDSDVNATDMQKYSPGECILVLSVRAEHFSAGRKFHCSHIYFVQLLTNNQKKALHAECDIYTQIQTQTHTHARAHTHKHTHTKHLKHMFSSIHQLWNIITRSLAKWEYRTLSRHEVVLKDITFV